MNQRGRNNPNWRGRAHKAVAHAKKTGRLVPGPCEGCGSPDVQAHHEDYSKPLEVRWLCRRCHGGEHTGIAGDRFFWRGQWRTR